MTKFVTEPTLSVQKSRTNDDTIRTRFVSNEMRSVNRRRFPRIFANRTKRLTVCHSKGVKCGDFL